MKQFDKLSIRGKASRLKSLVMKMLGEYDLDVREIKFIGMYTNTIFRLTTRDGQMYAVRACSPGWRTDTDLYSEAMWLKALDVGTGIGAPVVLASRSGQYVLSTEMEGIPEGYRVMIMSWLPGTLLGKQLTEANLFKMGSLFAALHDFSEKYCPPPGFTSRKMETLYARGENDVLFHENQSDAFSGKTRPIFEKLWEQVQAAFAQLYANPAGLRVIHHDLWHDNIKVDNGRLRPFDFEDTVWGYPVQDIAMALQDLMMDVEPGQYERLASAFRMGYESCLTWPEQFESQIDTFRAGRMVWVANYIAGHQREHLSRYVDWAAGRFEEFMQTGRLRKVQG